MDARQPSLSRVQALLVPGFGPKSNRGGWCGGWVAEAGHGSLTMRPPNYYTVKNKV